MRIAEAVRRGVFVEVISCITIAQVFFVTTFFPGYRTINHPHSTLPSVLSMKDCKDSFFAILLLDRLLSKIAEAAEVMHSIMGASKEA